MPYGDNSPLIGSTVDPRLFIQDFSPYERQNQRNQQAISSNINSALSMGMDLAKEKKELESKKKAGVAHIEYAMGLYPSYAKNLEAMKAKINDPDLSLRDSASIAEGVQNAINMSVGEGRHQEDMKMRQQGFDLDKRRADQDFASSEYNAKAIQDAAAITAEQATAENVFLRDQVGKLQGSGLIDQSTLAEIDAMKNPLAKHGAMQSIAKAVTPKAQPYRAAQIQEFSNPDGSKQIYERNPTTGAWELPRVAPDLTTFVANHEGFDPRAHADSGQTSIGYGTKAKPGETQISKEEAQRRLNEELAMHSERVDKAIAATGASFTPNERDALISFDFNTGAGESVISRFGKDKPALVAKMAEYNKLDKGDKSPSAGLVNRRNDEIALFQKPVGYTPAKPEFTAKESYEMEKSKKEEAEKSASALAKSHEMLDTLAKLDIHPGFNNIFGTNFGLSPKIDGSAAAGAKTLYDQLNAQGFLEAIKSMKGMGALSDAEGAKLDKAFLGLGTGMDEDEAHARIAELKTTLMNGIRKAKLLNPMAADNPRAAKSSRLNDLNAANAGQTTQR